MPDYIIRDAQIINEGICQHSDIYIKKGRIEKIASQISGIKNDYAEYNAAGKVLIPGIIDCHVHFREPGLTHKANIRSESYAAIAGGVTSFIDMPNTDPKTTTIEELKRKNSIASVSSYANYGFYMGATNNNLEELQKAKQNGAAGIKVFLGASTGNMLVDNETIIENLFSKVDAIITVHAEDEDTITRDLNHYKLLYGQDIPFECHEKIRSTEACLIATQKAISLAKKHGTRLHIAHVSTADEVQLLENNIPLSQKQITAEACVNHLFFDASDYRKFLGKIKCNPSIKNAVHKLGLIKGLKEGKIDIIATDHAPHTLEEKLLPYLSCPSGIPFVQHSINILLEQHQIGIFTKEQIVNWMCHHPAELFGIQERGYIREGYFADLCLIDMDEELDVTSDNVYYKCGWSPLEGKSFKAAVAATFVNGHLAYLLGKNTTPSQGMQLQFS